MGVLKRKRSIYSGNLIGLKFKHSDQDYCNTVYTIKKECSDRKDSFIITLDNSGLEINSAIYKRSLVENYLSKGIWIKI